MARKNDSPQKAAMREMMRDYLKNNDISIKNGTDVNSVMRDMMGNHLIVRDDMIAPFMEQIGEDAEPSEVYMKWMEVTEEILSKNRK